MKRQCAVAILVLACATLARAEMPGDVPDKFRFSIGGMAADAYTDAGLGSVSAGIGASINFEDTFGLDENKSVVRGEANWHITKRQFLDFGYLRLNRSGSRIISQDVEWGDFIYQTGANVRAGFQSQFPYAAWRWAFLDLPQVRISGSAGIDYLTLKAQLEASGNVTDQNGNPVSGDVKADVSVSAPVPQFGLQLDWALTKRMAILMYHRQIYISNLAGIDGGIGESSIRFRWWYVKHAGVSVGLDKESIDLKSYESGDKKARFRYEVRGFALYADFAF